VRKLNQSTSFSFGLSQNRLSRLAEASVFRVGKYFDLSAGLAYEDNDAFGLNANLRVRFENFLLSLNSRKVVGGISEYQLQESQIQTNLNAGYKFPWGSLSMFYRGNEREAPSVSVPLGDFFYGDIAAEPDTFNNSNYGLRISNGGIEIGGGRIKINAEISQNNDDSLFLMNVNYTFRGRQSEYSISPRYIREDAAGERSLGYKVPHQRAGVWAWKISIGSAFVRINKKVILSKPAMKGLALQIWPMYLFGIIHRVGG
jgi:hypothetical protein